MTKQSNRPIILIVDFMEHLPVRASGAIVRGQSFEELIAGFIRAQDVKENSRESYAKGLRKFLTWLRERNITSPTRQTILDYKMDLAAAGLSSYSISSYLVSVRKFFNWLEATRGTPNISKGIKGAKRARGFRKDPLTLPQVRELLTSIDRAALCGLRDYALITLLAHTGLRTIEALRANIGDLRQQGGEALLWIQGKGRDEKDDFVLLTGEPLKAVYKYLAERGPAKKDAPLFSSQSDRNGGGRLTTRSFSRIIKERLRAIGIDSERLTAHSLRHTAITLALQAGATIQEAQALARHANINTTLIYAHNIDRLKQAPERKIEALISGNIGNIDNIGNMENEGAR